MASRILMHKSRGVGAARVDAILNGNLQQVADTIPNGLESPFGQPLLRNSVAEFEGDVYVANGYNVYISIDGTGNWTLDFDADGISRTADGYDVGLYPTTIDNMPYLYHIWNSGNTTWVSSRKVSKFSSSGVWEPIITHTTTQNINDDGGSFIRDIIQFNNIVYFMTAEDNYRLTEIDRAYFITTFNMETESMGEISHPASLTAGAAIPQIPISFCAFNGELYYLMYYAGGISNNEDFNGIQVNRINGTATANLLLDSTFSSDDRNIGWGAFSDGSTPTNIEILSNKPVLFTDEDKLFALYYTEPNAGFKLIRMAGAADGSLSWDGDFTTQVIPTFLQSGNAPSQAGRWTTYTQVNASGEKEIYLTFSSNSEEGTSVSWYQFINETSPLDFLGFGADSTYSIPNYRQGGGAYEWSIFKPLDIQIEQFTPSTSNIGSIEISYRIIKGTGQPVTASFLFDTEGEPTNTYCDLVNPNIGIIVNNSVDGITADTGNLYTVNWRAELQGVTVGTPFSIVPIVTLV